MYLQFFCLVIIAVVVVASQNILNKEPVQVIVVMDGPINSVNSNMRSLDRGSHTVTNNIYFPEQGTAMNNMIEHKFEGLQHHNNFDGNFKQSLNLRYPQWSDRATTFFEKTNKAHLVDPSIYYRVTNDYVHGATPYASFMPISKNGEVNYVIRRGGFNQPTSY